MGRVLLPPSLTGAAATPATEPTPAELEALIREARARQRRRRVRLAAVVCAAGATAAAVYGIVRATSASPRLVHVSGGPVVDVRAFAGHGRLAFVSRGTLWLLDGEKHRLLRVPTPGMAVPARPVFSADGEWLAYLAQRRDPSTGSEWGELWIARADGSDAHPVRGFTAFDLYGWSPTADVLAVGAGPVQTTQPCPCFTPTTLRLVSPDGTARILARRPWIYSAAWSPDGRRLALGIEGDPAFGRPSLIAAYPVVGGKPTTWLRLTPRQRFGGMNGVLLEPAGWWRGFGIGFWIYGNGATHNLDATPLYAIAAPGEHPRRLGQTLSDGTTVAAAASSAGTRLALVTDVSNGVNGNRSYWDKKQVQVCTPGAACRGLVERAAQVTVDPAWSPTGTTLAFVEAPDEESSGWGQGSLVRWYDSHRLLLYDAREHTIREIPAAQGATVPRWSADGKSLLYVSRDELWLLPALRGTPVDIAGPLFPPHHWPAYFAQIAWSGQFAWSSR